MGPGTTDHHRLLLCRWTFGILLTSWFFLGLFDTEVVDGATKQVTVCVPKSKIVLAVTAKKACGKNEKKTVISATDTASLLCVSPRTKALTISSSGVCASSMRAGSTYAKNGVLAVCRQMKTRKFTLRTTSRCARGSVATSLPVPTASSNVVVDLTTTSTASTTTTTVSPTSTTTVPPGTTTTTTTVQPATITSFSAAATTINSGESTTLTAVWSGSSGSIDQSIGSVVSGSSVTVNPSTTVTYTLTVTNGSGHTVSQTVTVYVNTLAITTQPVSITTTSPFGETLTVGASSSGTLSYQWYRDGQQISGATGASYGATQDGTYAVTVTSTLNGVVRSATSQNVVFATNYVSISSQPAGGLIGDGDSLSLGVGANGSGNLSYQWKRNGVPLAGATSATYTATEGGSYSVTVTSTRNSVPNSLDSNSVLVDVNSVSIASEVTNQYVTTGTTSALGVTVTSHVNATVSYQWFRDNVSLQGETSDVIHVNQGGNYKVKVTSHRGGTTAIVYSSTMIVTEIDAPAVSSFGASAWQIGKGGSTQLTGSFTGGTGVITPGNIPATSGVAVTVSPNSTTTYTLTVTNAAGRDVEYTTTVNVTTGTFTATSNNSSVDRMSGHKAVTLANGKVLVFGNWGDTNVTDVYDPATNSFTRVGNMIRGRRFFSAVRLQDGRVLAIGGRYFNGSTEVGLASAEIFDPATETWTSTGSMSVAREGFFAGLLTDGKVFVAGGRRLSPAGNLSSAEIYDPATGQFTLVASMPQERSDLLGAVLPSGRVFVAGGYNSTNGYMKSALIYDPALNSWTAPESQMNSVHYLGVTLLMTDGRVMIAGGWSPSLGVATIEIFDPTTNTFAAAAGLPSMGTGRGSLTGHVLDNGKVAIFGGSSGTGQLYSTVTLYDPASNTFTAEINTMRWSRYDHASAKLNDGRVIIIGGNSSNRTSADVFAP